MFGQRLYIFGSHDKFGGKDYCENDYVTWSAPLDDLSDWRYYLYYSKADTSVIGVAVCDTPAGAHEKLHRMGTHKKIPPDTCGVGGIRMEPMRFVASVNPHNAAVSTGWESRKIPSLSVIP